MASTTQVPLVLVPGLLCSPALFAPQMKELGRDRHVIVADHTRADRMAELAGRILASGPERFALAGLSMGGYIALEIMRAAPQRVTHLALLDTSARPDVPERVADRRRLMEIARTDGVARVQRLLLPRLIHPDRMSDHGLVETVVRMAEDTGLDAFLRQQEAIITRPDSRPTLAAIRCPTLVLVGAEDQLTPPELASEMAGGIAGSRLVVVPHCGHLSSLERPEAVNLSLQALMTTAG